MSLFSFWQESGVMAPGDVLVGRAVRNLCLFEYVTIETLEVLDFLLVLATVGPLDLTLAFVFFVGYIAGGITLIFMML